jgi:hypothetical protein
MDPYDLAVGEIGELLVSTLCGGLLLCLVIFGSVLFRDWLAYRDRRPPELCRIDQVRQVQMPRDISHLGAPGDAAAEELEAEEPAAVEHDQALSHPLTPIHLDMGTS